MNINMRNMYAIATILTVIAIIGLVFAYYVSPSSFQNDPEVEHCLDIYSGGKVIWELKAEKTRTVSSNGSVEFINSFSNEPIIVHSDFIYYVCHETEE